MASPAPTLARLKTQLHVRYPEMKLAALGIMADSRHIKAGTSDHIGGNAIDIPAVLRHMEMLSLVLRLLLDPRVHYIIYDGWFYHPGKAPAVYTGSNPHKTHAHLSIIVAKRAQSGDWNLAGAAKPAPKPVPKPKEAAKVYDVGYVWLDFDIPAVVKPNLLAWCKANSLRLTGVRQGMPGRTIASIHAGEAKRGQVVAKLGTLNAVQVVMRHTSGGGAVAPDNTVRRLNPPTTTFL